MPLPNTLLLQDMSASLTLTYLLNIVPPAGTHSQLPTWLSSGWPAFQDQWVPGPGWGTWSPQGRAFYQQVQGHCGCAHWPQKPGGCHCTVPEEDWSACHPYHPADQYPPGEWGAKTSTHVCIKIIVKVYNSGMEHAEIILNYQIF